MGGLMLGSHIHCFTYFYWIAYKLILVKEGHSGYEFPWSPLRILPFVMSPSYHDHHHSHNVGNFAGNIYIWDLLMGTADHFFKEYLKKPKPETPS
jgi:sterol desaturase/sphingolipid hydroxylase (fatty acid hydroxylase superfamily)